MKIRWWKCQDMYQPLLAGAERKKFKRDCHEAGPSGVYSEVRMLGVPQRCSEDSYTIEVVLKLLEELLSGEGPFGQWPEGHLGEWLNDVNVTHFEDVEIALHSYVSLTKESMPRLESREYASGEIDNSMFSIEIPRSDFDDSQCPNAYTPGILYDEDNFPPVLQQHQDDLRYKTFCCQVNALLAFLKISCTAWYLVKTQSPGWFCNIRPRFF